MSFVSIVINPEFITCMSDGLIIRTEGKYIDGKFTILREFVRSEETPKFYKISKDQFVAYTGTDEWRKDLLKDIPENNIGENYDLKSLAYQIYKKSTTSEEAIKWSKLGPSFIVCGGINDDHKIEVHAIQSNEKRGVLYIPSTNERTLCLALTSPYLSDYLPGDILDEEINSLNEITPENVLQKQRFVNAEVAKRDRSVNDNCFSDVIRRS